MSKGKLLMTNSERHRRFRETCGTRASGKSWDGVQDNLLEAYPANFSSTAVRHVIPVLAASRRMALLLFPSLRGRFRGHQVQDRLKPPVGLIPDLYRHASEISCGS